MSAFSFAQAGAMVASIWEGGTPHRVTSGTGCLQIGRSGNTAIMRWGYTCSSEESGDAMWCASPDETLVQAYRDRGGEGRVIGQMDVAEAVVRGRDDDAAVERPQRYVRAGVADLHVHQVGPDPDAFVDAWSARMRDALGSVVS